MHFVQTALALVVSGGAILIIAAFVRESLHDQGRHLHLFPEAHDRPEIPVAKPAETAIAKEEGPFPHPRGARSGRSKRNGSRGDKKRETGRERQKEKRSGKSRKGTKHHAEESDHGTAVTEDV
ncbi:MAG TPA: hypothetical protein VKR31_14805 [Rhizomicrobium sp.]|nr:hypothetical protein [Rhizomicrobium sp.]